jgi:yecA family protein
VVAGRWRADGRVQLGAFLVDVWCLGIREAAFAEDFSEGEFRDSLERYLQEDDRQPIHPACAKKLIEGAVAYAKQFGFAPDHDFKKARRVFNGMETSACPETFTFGKAGKPFFVPAEDDSRGRIERVLSMLEARCGAEGFDYILPDGDDEPFDEEATGTDRNDPLLTRQDLFDWLEDEPEGVPRFYEVSGLITGMQLCPQVIMPTKILEVLWGPEEPTWASAEDLQSFLDLFMDYWNDISDLIMMCVGSGKTEDQHPVDIWDEDMEAGRDVIAANIDWATGFTRATEIWPHLWGSVLARPDLAAEWAVITWWSDFGKLQDAQEIEAFAKNMPLRGLNRAVAALARALRIPKP